MNLTVVADFKATPSPCTTCGKVGTEQHPECCTFCQPVNSYLISLGDLPHVPTPKVDPNMLKNVNLPCGPYQKCTPGEYKAASKHLKSFLPRYSQNKLALCIGVSYTTINHCLRLKKKRMDTRLLKKIMEFGG